MREMQVGKSGREMESELQRLEELAARAEMHPHVLPAGMSPRKGSCANAGKAVPGRVLSPRSKFSPAAQRKTVAAASGVT